MPDELVGQVALVTGAGRGIGRAIALALAGAGAQVMAVARTEDQLDALAAEHASIATCAVSLDTADGCAVAVEAARAAFGPVDVLISNAGTGSSAERPIWEQDPAVWHASLALNLHAPFELIRRLAPDMIGAGNGRGRVIVIASTAGLFGGPAMTAYCAAKHGVIGLVRAAALDLAPHGVTANVVNPGWVRTEMAEASARTHAQRAGVSVEEIWRRRTAGYASGRLPTAEEVAATVRFLAGPEASGISGETIAVALGEPW